MRQLPTFLEIQTLPAEVALATEQALVSFRGKQRARLHDPHLAEDDILETEQLIAHLGRLIRACRTRASSKIQSASQRRIDAMEDEIRGLLRSRAQYRAQAETITGKPLRDLYDQALDEIRRLKSAMRDLEASIASGACPACARRKAKRTAYLRAGR